MAVEADPLEGAAKAAAEKRKAKKENAKISFMHAKDLASIFGFDRV